MKTGIYAMLITLAVALASTNFTASAQSASDFAVGLKRPTKIIATPRGNFLVAGADTPRNSGQVSLIARGGGAHHVILGGLPSGLSVEGSPDGTTGLAIERRDSIYRRDEDDGDEPQMTWRVNLSDGGGREPRCSSSTASATRLGSARLRGRKSPTRKAWRRRSSVPCCAFASRRKLTTSSAPSR